MADESLREIQINGKQLVFVFMAATVVAVVVFLSGVMVGRTAPRGVALAAEAPAEETPSFPALDETAPLPAAPVGDGPVTLDEDITYPTHLEAPAAPDESLEAAVPEAVDEPALDFQAELPTEPVAEAPPEVVVEGPVTDADVASAAPDAGPALPADGDWVVQVAAVSERPAAEAIAGDLAGKGYPAFVTTPGADAPLVFRVRVGTYLDRRAAETVAGRLEREEQFRPWVTTR